MPYRKSFHQKRKLPTDYVRGSILHNKNKQKCKYADVFKHKIELVVIHPVTKAILIYAETSTEILGNFYLDEHFDLEKLHLTARLPIGNTPHSR